MAYTPVIIETADYGDIRLALGLGSADTTTLADATIEARTYLRFVETEAQRMIATATTIVDSGDADYDAQRADTLKYGVITWTASRLAALYFAGRSGEEVASTAVGPYTTKYRTGPDWQALAKELAREAAEALYTAERWGASVETIQIAGTAGPTRRARAADARITLYEWQEYLWPAALRGREFYDDDRDE